MNEQQQLVGVCSTWIPARGFGFLVVNTDGYPVRYFLHISRVVSGVAPQIGQKVIFDVSPVKEGNTSSAINAVLVDGGAL